MSLRALVLVPKCTAFLSLCGSSFMMFDMVRRPRWTTRHRLICGMCLCDVLSSLAWFVASWAIPSSLGNATLWNYGNWATCEAQGFLIQFSLGTIAYNTSLAVYYFLVIHRGCTEERIAKRYEPFMHATAIFVSILSGSIGVAKKLFNPILWECWVASYPIGCNGSDCERGHGADAYRWIMFYGPLWAAWILVTVMMVLVYRKISRLEKASNRYLGSGRQTRRFAVQAMLYVGVFYLTWLFTSIFQILSVFANFYNFELLVVSVGFIPMQGAFNVIVYVLPRFVTARRDYQHYVRGRRMSFFWWTSQQRLSGDRRCSAGSGTAGTTNTLELPPQSQLREWAVEFSGDYDDDECLFTSDEEKGGMETAPKRPEDKDQPQPDDDSVRKEQDYEKESAASVTEEEPPSL